MLRNSRPGCLQRGSCARSGLATHNFAMTVTTTPCTLKSPVRMMGWCAGSVDRGISTTMPFERRYSLMAASSSTSATTRSPSSAVVCNRISTISPSLMPALSMESPLNTRRVFAVLLIAWIGVSAVGNVCAEGPLVQPNQVMPLGERLVYKISWLGIPVGIGELWVKETTQLAGREVIHIVGVLETNRVLSKIFPMHDEGHSWIDAQTLESVQFEKKVNELLIKAHEKTVFDASSGTGYYESFTTGVTKEFPVTVPVHDVFSAFYWARRQALVPGASVATVLSCDQKDWALEVHVLRREIVKRRGTSVDTFRLEPITHVEGVEKRGKAWINVTTDASRTPVRIVYKAPFGPAVGTLKEVQSPEAFLRSARSPEKASN